MEETVHISNTVHAVWSTNKTLTLIVVADGVKVSELILGADATDALYAFLDDKFRPYGCPSCADAADFYA